MAEALPLFPGEDELRPDLFDQLEFPSTLGQTLEASFDLSQKDSTVLSIARIQTLNDAEKKGGKERPTTELNEMFKEQGVTFEKPMNLRAATLIADRRTERAKLQNVIDRGPSGGFYGIAKFAAAILPHALDPIDFAAGIATGGILAVATKGTRFGLAIGSAGKSRTAAQAFKYTAVEGALGNIAVEPLVYVANKREAIDYGVTDAFINAVGGAVGFAGIRYGGGKVVNLLNRIPSLKEMSVRSAISRAGVNKKIRSDLFQKQYVREISGSTENISSGRNAYEFKSLVDADINDHKFYVPFREPRRNISGVRNTPAITDDLGDGIYISDSPHVSNGVAASHFNESVGSIIEVKTSDLKLLNLDEVMPDEVGRLFKERFPNEPEALEGTVREAIENIQNKISDGKLSEEVMEEVNSALKAAGFDGYRGVQQRYLGEELPPSNQLMVFSESAKKIKQTSDKWPTKRTFSLFNNCSTLIG